MTEKTGDLRAFIFILSGICLLIGIWPMFRGAEPRWVGVALSIVLIITGIFRPRLLFPLYKIWAKFGRSVAKVNSLILLSVVFYLVLLPIGLVAKLFKINRDRFSFLEKKDSYWIKKEPVDIQENMLRPF